MDDALAAPQDGDLDAAVAAAEEARPAVRSHKFLFRDEGVAAALGQSVGSTLVFQRASLPFCRLSRVPVRWA